MTGNIPALRARIWWEKHHQHTSFDQFLSWCVTYGVVYSDSSILVAARPWQVGAQMYAEVQEPDTWFLYIAGGDGATPLARFMQIAPYPLPHVAFHRRGKLKLWSWENLKRHLYGIQRRSTTA